MCTSFLRELSEMAESSRRDEFLPVRTACTVCFVGECNHLHRPHAHDDKLRGHDDKLRGHDDTLDYDDTLHDDALGECENDAVLSVSDFIAMSDASSDSQRLSGSDSSSDFLVPHDSTCFEPSVGLDQLPRELAYLVMQSHPIAFGRESRIVLSSKIRMIAGLRVVLNRMPLIYVLRMRQVCTSVHAVALASPQSAILDDFDLANFLHTCTDRFFALCGGNGFDDNNEFIMAMATLYTDVAETLLARLGLLALPSNAHIASSLLTYIESMQAEAPAHHANDHVKRAMCSISNLKHAIMGDVVSPKENLAITQLEVN